MASNPLKTSKLKVDRFTYLYLIALIFFFALLAGGLELYPSLELTALIFGFSAPIYLILSDSKIKMVSLTLSLFLSLVASTIVGSLLFAFTPISSISEVLPLLGFLILLSMAVIFLMRKGKGENRKISSQETYGLFTTALLLIPAAYMLKSSYPVRASEPFWLPDDFPFFAVLANDVSQGIPSEGFFSGLTINYHWLTYAFFGGINRSADIDQLQGLVTIPPVLGWLLLCLGAIAVVNILTNLRSAAVLTVIAILFANSVGLAPYATSSLGGTIVSPSTLLTSSWFLASVLLTHVSIKCDTVRLLQAPLMLTLGFSIALGKISTALISGMAMVLVIGFNYIQLRPCFSMSLKKLTKALVFLVLPFLIGIGIVRFLFLSTTETPLGLEDSLFAFQNGNLALWIVALLPVCASVFSFFVMVAPTIFDYKNAFRVDLIFVSSILSVVGLSMIFLFDFGAGNEAWFLIASLALILPTSSVAVIQILNAHLSEQRGTRIQQILLFIGIPFASASGLLLVSESPELEVRPWLLPAILIAIFLVCGFFYVLLGAVSPKSLPLIAILGLCFAGMFLLSIVFGLLLRAEVTISSFQDRQGVSALRDEWLSESKALANSNQAHRINSPIAIYSDSAAESTLTRWIPYLLATQSYNLNPNDSITDYFTPREVLLGRQETVRSFVLERDLRACQTLESDGVEWIWRTQGLDLENETPVTTRRPTLIKVECGTFTSQPQN